MQNTQTITVQGITLEIVNDPDDGLIVFPPDVVSIASDNLRNWAAALTVAANIVEGAAPASPASSALDNLVDLIRRYGEASRQLGDTAATRGVTVDEINRATDVVSAAYADLIERTGGNCE